MSRASELFDEQDRAAIAAAVERAEQQTSAEIIPAVASASGRYDRAEDVFGLLFALALLAVAWIGLQGLELGSDWSDAPTPALGLLPVILIIVAGFAVGAAVAARVPALRQPFVKDREMREEVERAAGEAFYRLRLRRTDGATGILVYISLQEHMVRVVGDDAVAARLTQDDWDQVRDLAIEGLRDGRAAEGVIAAIERCGELCAPHFPRAADDADELTNELRILD